MGTFAGSDVAEFRHDDGTDGVEIAHDHRRPLHRIGDVLQLEAVEELAMGQMHIGES